jgi:hypothetical protein
MYTKVHLLGDATEWTLADADVATLRDTGQTAPVAVPVAGPIAARLIISPHALAAVAALPLPPGGDWMPSYVTVPQAHVYLPSATGAGGDNLGYALATGTDLAALEEQVIAAMHGRHRLEIPLADDGTLVVNGATVAMIALVAQA